MKKINVALIGAGTIGSGVVDTFLENKTLIAERVGVELILKYLCDTDENALSEVSDIDGLIKTGSTEDIFKDPEIDIVIELIGGEHPAKEFVIEALKNKKHIVTANKALLSAHWNDIFTAANDNGCFVGFEASVGGGIPVIKVIRESLASNKIEMIYGILNGTTNFILSKMSEENKPFKEALQVAQEIGIAEKDPTLDISGKDSAHKLAILSLLSFGIDISPDDVYTEGIEKITPMDIEYAANWGYSIKLLAIAKKTSTGVDLRVHPALVTTCNLLANVKGEDNAVFIKGDFSDESLLYGKGAGRRPTASAVMGDVVEIAKHVAFYGKEDPMAYRLQYAKDPAAITGINEIEVPFYLRFSVIDKPGVLSGISGILAKNNISIATMSQEERKEGREVPVIMLTHIAVEGDMRKAIDEINSMDYISGETVVLRIEA
jgi:homoserine dehydrogenase